MMCPPARNEGELTMDFTVNDRIWLMSRSYHNEKICFRRFVQCFRAREIGIARSFVYQSVVIVAVRTSGSFSVMTTLSSMLTRPPPTQLSTLCHFTLC